MQYLILAVVLISPCLVHGVDSDNDYSQKLSHLAKRFSLKTTAEDGSYDAGRVQLFDTPEAGWMYRSGDIDNFGQVWKVGQDPFFGRLGSVLSDAYLPPYPVPEESVEPVDSEEGPVLPQEVLEPFITVSEENETNSFNVGTIETSYLVHEGPAVIQFYLATTGQSKDSSPRWSVKINESPQTALASALSEADFQSGQGYLLTWQIPQQEIPQEGEWSFELGAEGAEGFGFGVDFVKFMSGLKGYKYRAAVEVTVMEGTRPKAGIDVIVQGVRKTTDARGQCVFEGLAPGYSPILLDRPGSGYESLWIHLPKDMKRKIDLNL